MTSELGISKFYDTPDAHVWPWFWASTVLLIVAHDTWFYWTHRLIHHPKLFRRFHRLHHRSNNPTPFTAYAFDAPEAAINGVYLLLIGLVMPASILSIFIFTAHMMLRNAVGHCGYELFPRTRDGRPLLDWLTTVTHHDLHHAAAGWNYGLYFTFWDRVMGAEHPEHHAKFAEAVRRPVTPATLTTTAQRRQLRAPAQTTSVSALCGLALAAALHALAAADPAETPIDQSASALAAATGRWATEGYGAVVALQPCSDAPARLCGRLEWTWDPLDAQALDLGEAMLSDFVFADGTWTGGRLIHPQTGRRYSGEIRQTGPDVLKLTGCAARLFYASETWRRLESLPHRQDAH